MNTKKVVPAILLVVCGLVTLFLLNGIWQANESVEDSTREYPSSGAISEAIASEIAFDEIKDEASQFGLRLWLSDVDDYKNLRDRLSANEALASALKTAKDQGVPIFLDTSFLVSNGFVSITVDATDQEIIEFLLASVTEAIASEIAFDEIKDEASQFGLRLWLSDVDDYKNLRDRLSANEALASALKTAKDQGVPIFLDTSFLVSNGFVSITVDATDQEIIEFLLGT